MVNMIHLFNMINGHWSFLMERLMLRNTCPEPFSFPSVLFRSHIPFLYGTSYLGLHQQSHAVFILMLEHHHKSPEHTTYQPWQGLLCQWITGCGPRNNKTTVRYLIKLIYNMNLNLDIKKKIQKWYLAYSVYILLQGEIYANTLSIKHYATGRGGLTLNRNHFVIMRKHLTVY